MIILGLDPGLARTGFGLIDTSKPDLFVSCGCLETGSHQSIEDRLLTIGQDLDQLIIKFKPDHAVVEKVFFGANSKTAMLTSETRGVLLYVLRQHRLPVTSLTPLQIKSRLSGYGKATKQQVGWVVAKRLNLQQPPQPDDAADALAAALGAVEISNRIV